MIQIADLTGPMGVSFVMVMVTGGLYDAGRAAWATHRQSAGATAVAVLARAAGRRMVIPAAVVAVVLAYGFVRMHQIDRRRETAPKARVGIVQANVGIQEKWDPRPRARDCFGCIRNNRSSLPHRAPT